MELVARLKFRARLSLGSGQPGLAILQSLLVVISLGSASCVLHAGGVILPRQLEEKCANGTGCAWLVAQHKLQSDGAEIQSLTDKGKYKDAEAKADALITFSERHWGPDSAYTAAALENRTRVSSSLGRFVEAEESERRALTNYETALGPEHPHVGAALDSLGDIYANESRKADAEQCYKKSLAVYENNANVWYEVGLIAEDWF